MKVTILFLSIEGYHVLSPKKIISPHANQLRHDINTDELYPISALYFYENISEYLLTGDRLLQFSIGQIKNISPKILVAGHNFGCGSAREHPAIALKEVGVEVIFAYSFNSTFRQNCLHLGIYTSTNLNHLERIVAGRKIPFKKIAEEFQDFEKEIVSKKGLFNYNLARLQEQTEHQKIKTASRAMTVAEKIISNHLKGDIKQIKPDDQIFVYLDFRMSYEIFTPLIASLLEKYAPNQLVKDAESIIIVADHFLCSKKLEVKNLLKKQKKFALKNKTVFYDNNKNWAKGICHTLMIENHLLPGQLAAGTDSHSSMWGVTGALGIPVGATAMANAFLTKDFLLTVPDSIKISFKGKLAKSCTARDVAFYIMTLLSPDQIQGKVLEFNSQSLNWSVDELSVMANQAKEMGALSCVMIPNKKTIEFLSRKRKISIGKLNKLIIYPDKNAKYFAKYKVDLNKIRPMIAKPGNPRDVVKISSFARRPKIKKAYIGSCVGGKWEDVKKAVDIIKGTKIAKGVKLIFQPASKNVYEKMVKNKLITVIKRSGGQVIPCNCGGCIGQGEARLGKNEVGIFSSTRNYTGRLGLGKAYLASPETVAASAIAGKICYKDELIS